jgi:hypothetical protein
MSAVPHTDQALPRRPRRRLVTGPTMIVLALVTCAIGLYAGIRIEKSHATASASAGGGFARLAAGRTSARSGATAPSFAGRTGSFTPGAGAGGGTTGTVSSVNGRTLVLSETGGNTVKVKLTSSTTITKTQSVGHNAVHPGDTISVTGSTSQGALTAASVTDSGDSSTSTTGSSGSAASTGSSGGGVSSLFGG